MSTVTTNNETNVWNGGEGVKPMNATYGKLMMWFFLISDAFTFAAFLTVYGVARHRWGIYEGTPDAFVPSVDYWPIPEKIFNAFPGFHGSDLPLAFVALMTMILILSSVTMVLAVEAGQRMDKKDVQKWLLLTIIGGAAFLGCQAWEWGHFIHGSDTGMTLVDKITGIEKTVFGANLTENEYGPVLFANLFFFITGFHGTHVLSGVVLLILAFYQTAFGIYERRGHYEMVEKIGLYWHFVDLVWVFVFTFFYLV